MLFILMMVYFCAFATLFVAYEFIDQQHKANVELIDMAFQHVFDAKDTEEYDLAYRRCFYLLDVIDHGSKLV